MIVRMTSESIQQRLHSDEQGFRIERVAGWGERSLQSSALGEFCVDEAQEPTAARTLVGELQYHKIRTHDEHVLVQPSRHVLADNLVFWILVIFLPGEALV